jgi:hypothetical protein
MGMEHDKKDDEKKKIIINQGFLRKVNERQN